MTSNYGLHLPHQFTLVMIDLKYGLEGDNVDISVEFCGMRFRSPVFSASGPPGWNGKSLRKAAESGAGAVITKTMLLEEFRIPHCGRVWEYEPVEGIKLPLHGLEGYSELSVEQWLDKELEEAAGGGAPVIASVRGYYPELDKTARIVKMLSESPYVSMIELNVSCPIEIEEGEVLANIEQDPSALEKVTRVAKEASSVPVMVKLGLECNRAMAAKAIERGGGDAISLINNPWSILPPDVETGEMQCPSPGGLCGPALRNLALAAMVEVVRSTHLPVVGIGGVLNWQHAMQFILLGASAVQSCTGVILRGYRFFEETNRGIQDYLKRKGYENINSLRGKTLRERIISFNQQAARPRCVARIRGDNCSGCGACLDTCFYGAIDLKDGVASVNEDLCSGCRVCVITCPMSAISFEQV
ncbi:MAG TPA: 4Fe-4S binding protein [Clostridia bacterium]|nr:4Fe-4S binding protein [Clostridia bacterium]